MLYIILHYSELYSTNVVDGDTSSVNSGTLAGTHVLQDCFPCLCGREDVDWPPPVIQSQLGDVLP